ncbi:MAG: C39 family peptidase [Candidatus Berkelbacteria bacterium]
MKNLHKNLIVVIVCLISFNLAFSPTFFAYAATSSVINDLNAKKKAQEEILKKAAAEQAQKEKEAAALSAQISYVGNQITQTQNAIISTDNQVTATQNKIAELGNNITTQEANLATEQKTMDKVIASLYMEGDSGLLESLLSSNSITEAITNQQYYESIQQQVEGSIQRITKIKTDLNAQKDQKDKQLADLTELKTSQVTQKNFLEGRKTLKSELLSDNKVAVQSLEAEKAAAAVEIANLTKKIQDAYKAAGGGGKSKGPNIHGPTAMSLTYYSQNDSRWASKTLGPDGPDLDSYGCLMTSLAMVATSFGLSYDPGSLTDASSFYDSSNSSSASWGNFRYFNSTITGLSNYQQREGLDYNKIDSELSKGYPVIVGVNIAIGHWIVLTGGSKGNYSWYDPYTKWGSNPDYNNYSFFAMRTFD